LFSEPNRGGVAVLEEIVNYDKISDISINGKPNIKKVFIHSEGADVLFDKPKECKLGKENEASDEYFIRCEE